MIIPSKHSGYQAGIRLYPGGGGDAGGGGGGVGVSPDFADSTGGGLAGSNQNAGTNNFGESGYFGTGRGGLFGPVNTGGLSTYSGPDRFGGFDGGGSYQNSEGGGNTVVKKTQPTSTTAGASIIAPDNPTLKAMQATGQPYDKLGGYYNSFLQQGYSDSAIRNALRSQGQRGGPSQPVSDSDYELLVQNAGMTSPTGRPFAGSGQFTQPVYNSQYQNYTNPYNFSNVSDYGTASRFYQPQQQYNPFSYQQPQSMGYVDPYSGRATGLANPTNFANQRFQQQQQYNPYQQQQQYNPFSYNEQSNSPPRSMGLPNPTNYNEQSNSPPQSMGLPNPDSYVDSYSGRATGLANPTNFQQPQQQQQQYNPYQQQQYNPFGYQQQQYNPYQQQQYSPFSYQQQYNPYDSYPQTYQQPQPVVPTSSGPSQAIYGRSSAMRGTPNVMRRAEGGIAGILKK